MAELPDVGKNCALEACQRLDYTPFECRQCRLSFCYVAYARLTASRTAAQLKQNGKSMLVCHFVFSGASLAPLRPFLCSTHGCFAAESIKIVCPGCELNFCLKHRHDTDHDCSSRQKMSPEAPPMVVPRKNLAETCENASKQPKEKIASQPRLLSADEQRRADKIAVMKIKTKASAAGGPNKIAADEMIFLFVVTADGQRRPISVSKKWSVGRCVDSALSMLAIPNENGKHRAKMYRFRANDETKQAHAMDASIELVAPDMSTVYLLQDE